MMTPGARNKIKLIIRSLASKKKSFSISSYFHHLPSSLINNHLHDICSLTENGYFQPCIFSRGAEMIARDEEIRRFTSLSRQSLMWKENSSGVLPEGSAYAETFSDAVPVPQYGDKIGNCHALNKNIPLCPSHTEGSCKDNAGPRLTQCWHHVDSCFQN